MFPVCSQPADRHRTHFPLRSPRKRKNQKSRGEIQGETRFYPRPSCRGIVFSAFLPEKCSGCPVRAGEKKTRRVKKKNDRENVGDLCSSRLGLRGVTAELGHREVWASTMGHRPGLSSLKAGNAFGGRTWCWGASSQAPSEHGEAGVGPGKLPSKEERGEKDGRTYGRLAGIPPPPPSPIQTPTFWGERWERGDAASAGGAGMALGGSSRRRTVEAGAGVGGR